MGWRPMRRQYMRPPGRWRFLTTNLSGTQRSCFAGNSFVKKHQRRATGMSGPARAGEAEHRVERLGRAGPVLADKSRTGTAEHGAERERHEYGVVELAGHRDEVRDEVEGHRQ